MIHFTEIMITLSSNGKKDYNRPVRSGISFYKRYNRYEVPDISSSKDVIANFSLIYRSLNQTVYHAVREDPGL